MYENLHMILSKMKMDGYMVKIYVDGPEDLAVGYIFKVGDDYVALGREKEIYTFVIPLGKIVMVEIVETPTGE